LKPRAFTPFGGPGFRPPFRPFPHPFFPRRFLFPFFFFSPFFFPFFREDGEDARNDMYFAVHQTLAGDTLEKVSHMYNIPCVILEEATPHIGNPNEIQPSSSVYIPRISHMHCSKTYIEREVEAQSTMPHGPNKPYPGAPYNM